MVSFVLKTYFTPSNRITFLESNTLLQNTVANNQK